MRCLHPITQETSEIDSKGQSTPMAWFSRAWGYGCSLLANFSVWYARASKNLIFWKIQNKYFYLSYSNETFYIKALEYKEYFTANWFMSLEDIQVFLNMKYKMFGHAVSKYTIVLVCV
jgi:hypothetical protein